MKWRKKKMKSVFENHIKKQRINLVLPQFPHHKRKCSTKGNTFDFWLHQNRDKSWYRKVGFQMNKRKNSLTLLEICLFITIYCLAIFIVDQKINEQYTTVTCNDKIVYQTVYIKEINSDFKVTEIIKEPSPGEFLSVGLDEDFFYEMSDKYRICAGYALSVFVLEAGHGTSPVWMTKNNPAGIKCGADYCLYKSREDGIEAMFKLMNTYAYEKELITIAQQRSLWSTADDAYKIVDILKGLEEKGDNEK